MSKIIDKVSPGTILTLFSMGYIKNVKVWGHYGLLGDCLPVFMASSASSNCPLRTLHIDTHIAHVARPNNYVLILTG